MSLYRVTNRIVSPTAGGECINVIHIRTVVSGTGEDRNIGEAIDALATTYDQISNVMARNAVVTVGETVIRDPYGSPTYANVTPIVARTADEGAQAPPHLAIVVGLRTTAATRTGRGRVFLGPLNSLAVESDDGTIRTDRLQAVRNAWEAFVADSVSANGWGLAVYSTVDKVARDVTSVSVRDSLAVMRSRRP